MCRFIHMYIVLFSVFVVEGYLDIWGQLAHCKVGDVNFWYFVFGVVLMEERLLDV